ncbi:hypothetical protein CWI38_0007p0050 [Hamiltosporidium tvaerminnensis]|uniref:Uncharacterized protein n=1 Tax=Hamiltosporidium tvaerminnensis TaxID=1176355 RepID=A0A4Q9M2G2_9MICR|nr:hypothetical protein CWI38_0007p0050 [Hamiltosporidium tvaerminnensis]
MENNLHENYVRNISDEITLCIQKIKNKQDNMEGISKEDKPLVMINYDCRMIEQVVQLLIS